MFVWDLTALFVSIWASYVVRLGVGEVLIAYSGQALVLSLVAVLLKAAALASLGVFRVYWGHMAQREYLLLFRASLLGSLLLAAAVLIAVLSAVLVEFPRSILAIDFVVATSLLFLGRKLLYRSSRMVS